MPTPPNRDQSVSAGLLVSLSWLDRLTWATLLFSFAAAAARLFEQAGVPLFGANIPLRATFIAFIVFTALHLFVMKHILISCADAWLNLPKDSRILIYESVVRSGGLMTKGAQAYRDSMSVAPNGDLLLRTELNQAPTWVHIALSILCFAALVDLQWSWLLVVQSSFALSVWISNWKIGSNWILALADLGSDKQHSDFFKKGETGPRKIGHISGFFIGKNIPTRSFVIETFIEMAFNAILVGIIFSIPFGLLYISIMAAR